MKVKICKSKVKGTIKVPASKSYSHRYLLAAMLSNNASEISNLYFSNDILATLNCMSSFGCEYLRKENSVSVFSSNKINDEPIFDCLESGSTLRFLIPIALTKYERVVFKGSEKLLSRGIEVYEQIFRKQNIKVIKNKDSLIIEGKLKSGIFDVDGSVSSQFITGLLYALPLLDGDSIINIIPPLNSKNYVDMTIDVLKKYGISLEINNLSIKVKGNQKYSACNYVIEGDYSNAAFLDAFNYIEGNVMLEGLNQNSLQGDKIYREYFEILNKSNATLNIENCIDLGPVLMAFAAIKHGAVLTGTKRLKIKESDRAFAMKEELSKLGVQIDIGEDSVTIHKNEIIKPKESFKSHNDHRIVMSLALFASLFDICIDGVEAVNKSYPHYFKDLEVLGVKIEYDL